MKSQSARFDCAVIGGGAAGMFAAITAAAGGLRVALLEPNERLGKKLGITGKGRCNVTNHCTPEEALQQIPRGGRFLMSALHRFTPEDTMEFFESRRCPLKTERGNRVFPVSDRSFDIVDVLRRELDVYKRQLHDSNPVWVLQGVEDGARVVPLDEACGGTVGNALAAVGALRLGDVAVAGDVDGRPGAGSGDVPDVHILDTVADLDAAHTLDALVFVPDQGRVIAPAFAAQLCFVGGVDQVMVVGQLLQGAVSAANAQSAAGVVLGENEPQVCPSSGPDLRTVGVDDHTVLHQIFTCRDEPHVADNLDSADAARADLVDVLEIAEGWNLNFCHAGSFQNRRILRDLDHFVVNRYRYHALFRPPLKLP